MADSLLTALSSSLQVTDVSDIIVTEIVPDGEGGFVRNIRIMGALNGALNQIVLEITVRTSVEDNIDITTPALNF